MVCASKMLEVNISLLFSLIFRLLSLQQQNEDVTPYTSKLVTEHLD